MKNWFLFASEEEQFLPVPLKMWRYIFSRNKSDIGNRFYFLFCVLISITIKYVGVLQALYKNKMLFLRQKSLDTKMRCLFKWNYKDSISGQIEKHYHLFKRCKIAILWKIVMRNKQQIDITLLELIFCYLKYSSVTIFSVFYYKLEDSIIMFQ